MKRRLTASALCAGLVVGSLALGDVAEAACSPSGVGTHNVRAYCFYDRYQVRVTYRNTSGVLVIGYGSTVSTYSPPSKWNAPFGAGPAQSAWVNVIDP